MRVRRALVTLPLLLALTAPAAVALTDEEIFRDFRFNLINPGARSLALAGAFITLADDATAAQANPAGLSFLLTSEYFAEVRVVDNAARSSILMEQLPAGVETFVATGTDLDDTVGASFVSAVTSYSTDKHWTMGLSRQEVINVKNDTLSSFAFTFGGESPSVFLAEGAGLIDVEVVNINVSLGFRINDKLGVGATLTGSTLDVRAEVVNDIVDTGMNVAPMEILEPTLDLRTSIDDSDDDVVFSAGIIYKSRTWSFGGVFRKGPSFLVEEKIDAAGLDVFNLRGRLGTRFGNRFSLPDTYGAGASWKNDKELLTLALNVERILYSNLLDGYVAGVNTLTGADAEFTIDDGTDLRFGAEYVLPRKLPVALRGGVFTESDSTIRAVDAGSSSFATVEAFRGRDTQVHGTLGVGLSFNRYKIDVAADFSESDNEYLVSFIYQGKK